MKTSSGLSYRQSTRLRDFDYAGGGSYYVTICSYERACTFSDVVAEKIELKEIGSIIEREWIATPMIRPGVILDSYVVMPNHMHLTFYSPDSRDGSVGRAATRPYTAPRSLSSIIGQFKSTVTRAVRRLYGKPDLEVWQRGFYDHVIRDNRDLERIREYIRTNPLRWAFDRENPAMRGLYKP